MDEPAVVPWALYGGLAATTCSMLLVQQFLTRVFTIYFNSGLAFLAISITFLGLGSAGVVVYVFPNAFATRRIPRLVPVLALLYALALVGGFIALVALDEASRAAAPAGPEPVTEQVWRVLGSSLLVLPALFLVGLVISLLLKAHAARVGRLYGADLVGGGVGCLLVLPLMNRIGGDQGIFAIGLLAAAGAALLAHAHGRRVARLAGGLALLALLGVAWANRGLALVDVRSRATDLQRDGTWALAGPELRREWNALARLGFFRTQNGSSIYVRIDSGCQTSLPAIDPAVRARYVESVGFERLPYVLSRHGRYLEIGAGGGRGMVLAAAHGSESITGVEINPGIVRAALGGFPGFGVSDLVAEGHQLVLDEGRSWVRGSDERFDTITITFIQTGIASGSAAFALSEANLFTVEAFTEFLGKLTDGGLFYVYRTGGNEMLRLIGVAREALARLGIDDVAPRLYVVRDEQNHALLMVGLEPFSEDEVRALDGAGAKLGLHVLYSPFSPPGEREPNPFLERVRAERAAGDLSMPTLVGLYRDLVYDTTYESIERAYITSPDPEAFLAEYPIDVRPTHDDRPYYFFYGLNDPRELGLYFDTGGRGILAGTVILLFWMAAAFTVLVAALILLPLLLRPAVPGSARASRRTGLAVLAYFTGIGFGYIGVQISFIQRFTLFLGHPVYAISIVLLAFLLSSGVGSVLSRHVFRLRWMSVGHAVAAVVVLLLVYNRLLPAVFHSSWIGWPLVARVLLSILLIFPLAFSMGLLFPEGIRLVTAAAPRLTPWAWGANSAASVLGSIFALILAIHLGFTWLALLSAGIYAAACPLSAAVLRRAA